MERTNDIEISHIRHSNRISFFAESVFSFHWLAIINFAHSILPTRIWIMTTIMRTAFDDIYSSSCVDCIVNERTSKRPTDQPTDRPTNKWYIIIPHRRWDISIKWKYWQKYAIRSNTTDKHKCEVCSAIHGTAHSTRARPRARIHKSVHSNFSSLAWILIYEEQKLDSTYYIICI